MKWLSLIAASVALFAAAWAHAAPMPSKPGLARVLLQGCLRAPAQQTAERIASEVGAKPYSDVRLKRELKTTTTNFEEPGTGEDQRTKTTVTVFRGWDLPGPGAGALEYQEERFETEWVERSSRQTVKPVQTSLARSCRLHAPVANARSIFELYETMAGGPYGIRISADRRWIDFFMFDEDRFDIELTFMLRNPLARLAPDPARQEGHLFITDGGPLYFDSTTPGIPTIKLTHAELLAGLDQEGGLTFLNMNIEPVVQRLTANQPRP